ncbi:MAG: hypothetical protein M3380_07735, partial [Chloroflexota bacterium]|nr:hypothetical protein [Chloroflexota bacterium]
LSFELRQPLGSIGCIDQDDHQAREPASELLQHQHERLAIREIRRVDPDDSDITPAIDPELALPTGGIFFSGGRTGTRAGRVAD